MTNLDSILKSRDITLPTKVHLVKAMVFPVVVYGCESWTVKKAECWRIDGFELWCLRLLRVPWTARRSNQSILKEISPGCSLKGMMLKLKLQYFGHLMRRVDSLERPWWWEGLGHEFEWTLGVGDGQGGLACCDPWSRRVGHDWATELNWTEYHLSVSASWTMICILFVLMRNMCCMISVSAKINRSWTRHKKVRCHPEKPFQIKRQLWHAETMYWIRCHMMWLWIWIVFFLDECIILDYNLWLRFFSIII